MIPIAVIAALAAAISILPAQSCTDADALWRRGRRQRCVHHVAIPATSAGMTDCGTALESSCVATLSLCNERHALINGGQSGVETLPRVNS